MTLEEQVWEKMHLLGGAKPHPTRLSLFPASSWARDQLYVPCQCGKFNAFVAICRNNNTISFFCEDYFGGWVICSAKNMEDNLDLLRERIQGDLLAGLPTNI